MKEYSHLRSAAKESRNRRSKLFIHDDNVLSNDKFTTREGLLLQKDPFGGILQTDRIVFGEAISRFHTMAKKQSAQKMICNIAYANDSSIQLGRLEVSLINPLFLRYVYLNSYKTSSDERYSDLDLYNFDMDSGEFPNFDYRRVLHEELEAGDCIYVPSNWWIQLHYDMVAKETEDADENSEESDKKQDRETNIKWLEYHYPSVSRLEDEALIGLEEGYGS